MLTMLQISRIKTETPLDVGDAAKFELAIQRNLASHICHEGAHTVFYNNIKVESLADRCPISRRHDNFIMASWLSYLGYTPCHRVGEMNKQLLTPRHSGQL